MKRGLQTQAFTLVEVLIVLTVSLVLLVSSYSIITSKQSKAQFRQAANDVQSQVDSILNNVQTGYYNSSGNFTCTSAGSGTTLTNTANALGNNAGGAGNVGCIFLGRIVHFGVKNTGSSGFNIYDLAGQRQYTNASGILTDPAILADAKPVALSPGTTPATNSGLTGTAQVNTLKYGMQVSKMQYVPAVGAPTPVDTAMVAFVTDFALASGNGISAGSRSAQLYTIGPSALSSQLLSTEAVDVIDAASAANFKLAKSVTICFVGGANQNATLTIGGNGNQTSTSLTLGTGPCP